MNTIAYSKMQVLLFSNSARYIHSEWNKTGVSLSDFHGNPVKNLMSARHDVLLINFNLNFSNNPNDDFQ